MKNLTLQYLDRLEKTVCKRSLSCTGNEPTILKSITLPVKMKLARITLGSSLQLRKSERELKEKRADLSKEKLFELLIHNLKMKSDTPQIKYPTPVAGGVRELRYLLVIRKVKGVLSGLWEYDPALNQLHLLKSGTETLDKIFYEDWERLAYVNFLACLNLKKPSRKYPNNLLHCAFEAGTIFQSIQLTLTTSRLRSCISGHLYKRELDKALGSKILYPLYALSIH